MELKKGDIILNRYRIIGKIGEGGMSKVFLAEDLKLKSQHWAVKVIDKTSLAYKKLLKKDGTLLEVEVMKRLHHPLIPTISDIEETKDSLLIVMTYIPGETLQEKLNREGKQDEQVVIDWMVALCDLIAYLHSLQRPIAYRDIKPENILLSDNHLYVIDFGIAEYLDEAKDGVKIGTAGYVAPEQRQGKLDLRSDIYSIGITIYQLLTNKNPTKKDFEILPLSVSLEESNGRLDAIIRKATRPDKEHRYQEVRELRDDLASYKLYDLSGGNIENAMETSLVEVEYSQISEKILAEVKEEFNSLKLKQVKKEPFLISFTKTLIRTLWLVFLIFWASIGLLSFMYPETRGLLLTLIENSIKLMLGGS